MIRKYCVTPIKMLLGRQPARHKVLVDENDSFLVSYPKSGNTWIRYFIASLRKPQFLLGDIEKLVPDIYRNTNVELHRAVQPRILKSHSAYDKRYPKVLYIVRDPRDVFFSYYYHKKKFREISKNISIEDFYEMFMSGALDDFGTWAENVESWLDRDSNPQQFLMLRYEDLVESTISNVTNICNFLNIEASDEEILRAIDDSSKENIKKKEISQGHTWKTLNKARKDMSFIRTGSEMHLSDSTMESIKEDIRLKNFHLMARLGYQ